MQITILLLMFTSVDQCWILDQNMVEAWAESLAATKDQGILNGTNFLLVEKVE